jgi:hypothetical protein
MKIITLSEEQAPLTQPEFTTRFVDPHETSAKAFLQYSDLYESKNKSLILYT